MTTGRRVLVTGSTQGIGAALVERFLARGDCVFGCGRSAAPLSHDRYTHYAVDITDETAVMQMFKDLRTRAGGLDAVINNAGVARANAIALTPVADVRRIMDTNFLGVFLSTHQSIRLLRSSPAGRIVNLTSIAAPLRLEGEAVYAASKAAVEMFTRIAAHEVSRYGITCNAVGPSPIHTRLTASVPSSKMDALLARQAIPEWAGMDDVYNVIDFFLRPESRMVTGQVVYLGGIG